MWNTVCVCVCVCACMCACACVCSWDFMYPFSPIIFENLWTWQCCFENYTAIHFSCNKWWNVQCLYRTVKQFSFFVVVVCVSMCVCACLPACLHASPACVHACVYVWDGIQGFVNLQSKAHIVMSLNPQTMYDWSAISVVSAVVIIIIHYTIDIKWILCDTSK